MDPGAQAGGYASIERTWEKGDRLGGDHTDGVVLAEDLGPVERTGSFPYAEDQADNFEADVAEVPRLAATPATAANALRRAPGRELAFIAEGASSKGREKVTLRPFADLHYRHYNV